MTGKEKCKYLKTLRADVAKIYGIEGFEYKECPFTGDCSGTCPACDAKAEELYQKLTDLNKDLDVQTLKQVEWTVKNKQCLEQADTIGEISAPILEHEEAGFTSPCDDLSAQKPEPLMGKIVLPKDRVPIDQRPGRLSGVIRPPQEPQTHTENTKKKPRGLCGLFKRKQK